MATSEGGVRVVTHGCRLNAAESATMLEHARAGGHNNLIIHNTCAVTAEAVRSARQAVRRSARENPGARIVVTGCAAHTDGEGFAAMPEVDAVVGNGRKTAPGTWRSLPDFGVSASEKLRVDDHVFTREHAPHISSGPTPPSLTPPSLKPLPHVPLSDVPRASEGRARAFLGVQNGCDHACTFCIIPKGRGPSRSVPTGVVVEGARQLAGDGVAEIVLTGVDLTSWGGDLPGAPRLGDLVQAILAHVPDLPRLRLSSIDSIEADPALMDALGEARLMPHLHLSLQHGHDLILKRMRRRHLRDDALAFCEDARARRPGIALGADLIAGFPTETGEHHAANLSLIGECGLADAHIFPFSAREGTPAARMPPVPGPIIRERARTLRDEASAAKTRWLDARIGTRDEVVVHHGQASDGRRTGLTRDFCRALLPAGAGPGRRMAVRIVRREGNALAAMPDPSEGGSSGNDAGGDDTVRDHNLETDAG